MPTQRNPTARRASRQHKRLQRQPVPTAVREALDTALWFRSHVRIRAKKPVGQQELIEEILRWYLSSHNRHLSSAYEDIEITGSPISFWLDHALIERYRARARRDGVTKRQVIAAALTSYCRQRIPPALTRFRLKTTAQIQFLYEKHHARPQS